MKKQLNLLWLLVCAYHLGTAQPLNKATGNTKINEDRTQIQNLLAKMYEAMEGANQSTYTLKSKERFGDNYVQKEAKFRVQQSPKKVYFKDLEKGVEALYVTGWNGGKAFVNPNGFPWMNLSFDVQSSRMTEESHHTIKSAGFDFLLGILKKTEKQALKDGIFDESFTIKGSTEWAGQDCYRLFLEDKDYKFYNYTVTKDTELADLCKKLNVPSYVVCEKNKIPLGKVKAGKVLRMPSSYAKKAVFFVDKKTYLPIVQLVYDESGLLEHYEFKNLRINPKMEADEWSSDCKLYGF